VKYAPRRKEPLGHHFFTTDYQPRIYIGTQGIERLEGDDASRETTPTEAREILDRLWISSNLGHFEPDQESAYLTNG
jgi:hypothetical protein